MVSAAECVDVFGYAPGTVPPVGHRTTVPVVVDAEAAAALALLGGSGEVGSLLRLSTAELLALDFVSVTPIAVPEATEGLGDGLSD